MEKKAGVLTFWILVNTFCQGFVSMADERVQKLKKRRKQYQISQSRLAIQAEISRTYLNLLETEKKPLTDNMYERINKALERLNPDSALNMVIDYVRIRFKTTDARHVIEDILHLKMEYMLHEDFGYYGYDEHYEFGFIYVMAGTDEEKGTLLELKGQGSRQFEGLLEAQDRGWYDFFLECIREGCVFKRVDLAVNDVRGILDIPELTEKCNNEECISKFRSFKSYRSGELVRRDEKVGMGYTLYIGSLKSDIYFCAYEKDYEQYMKKDIPIEEVPIKNRFEIRLMNERAENAVEDLLTYRDAEHTAFGIINHYVRFVDRDDTKPREDWEVNDRWAWFLGEDREKVKLTNQPEPYTFRRTMNWLSHQVAPTWKMVQQLDEAKGTNELDEIVKNARLSERQEMLLRQCKADVSEVVL